MDASNILGSGMLGTMHPNDESSPIPFAVELGCDVTVEYKERTSPPTKVSLCPFLNQLPLDARMCMHRLKLPTPMWCSTRPASSPQSTTL